MKIYGLIGKSIQQSFSPAYFNDKFESLSLDDHYYHLFQFDSLDMLEGHDWSMVQGMNVTMPYKESIIPFLDGLSDDAATIGAVNTIQINEAGKWIGHNTDVFGFQLSLMGFLGDQRIENALVLGSGGASKAVCFVLDQLDILHKVVSRKGPISYTDLDETFLRDSQLIINTTPLGMGEYLNMMPDLPLNHIGKQHYLFDLIYNPEKTLFLEKGEQQGAQIQNGFDMLVFQAEKAWEIWNQKEIIPT